MWYRARVPDNRICSRPACSQISLILSLRRFTFAFSKLTRFISEMACDDRCTFLIFVRQRGWWHCESSLWQKYFLGCSDGRSRSYRRESFAIFDEYTHSESLEITVEIHVLALHYNWYLNLKFLFKRYDKITFSTHTHARLNFFIVCFPSRISG